MQGRLTVWFLALTLVSSLGEGANLPTDYKNKVYLYATKCRNNPQGFCINFTVYRCPDGYKVSLNGCGFLEWCCYPPVEPATTTVKPTTAAPVSGATTPATTAAPVAQCGVPSVTEDERIVGGTQTTIEANPWQISLRFEGSHICGGSIISDKWIITAAHCIQEVPNVHSVSQFTVLVGSTNSESFPRTNEHRVAQALTHGSYSSNGQGYDIALVKLQDQIDLSGSKAKTICLPQKGQTFDSRMCRVSGWGQVGENVQGSVAHLRKVSLPIISERVCRFYMGSVHETEICAGQVSGGLDSCQGDSGGPLACKQADGSYVLAGIVSGGFGCARQNTVGFYTEVAAFTDWIDRALIQYG